MKQLTTIKYSIKGFTLLEVLIALAILSIFVIPMVTTPVEISHNQGRLKEKTFAEFVALNKIAEIQLERNYPALGTKKGSALMAGREWFWEAKITKANSLFKNIRQIQLTVYANEDKDAYEIVKRISLVGKTK